MYKVKHWSIGLGGAAPLVLALAFVPSAFAAPSGWFDNTKSYTEDTGIVTAVPGGCIRMLNADVIDFYQRVAKGTPVVVL